MFELQGKWLLSRVKNNCLQAAGVVVDGGQETNGW